jgi:hypothetical protein
MPAHSSSPDSFQAGKDKIDSAAILAQLLEAAIKGEPSAIHDEHVVGHAFDVGDLVS